MPRTPTPSRDVAALGGDGLRQGAHVLGRVQVALAVDLHGGADLGGEHRDEGPRLVAGELPEQDVPLPGGTDRVQLLDQAHAFPLGAVAGEQRLGRVGRGGHAGGSQHVERVESALVERHEGGHRAAPLPRGAVPHEGGEEPEQGRVRPQRQVDRRPRAQHRPEAVPQHRRFRQWRGHARGQPARIAPRGAGRDPVPFVDGDLGTALLQEPGRGQPDHPATDDRDPARRAGPAGGGDPGSTSSAHECRTPVVLSCRPRRWR